MRELTGGDLQGGALNSSEIVFSPGRIPREGGSFSADIGTAGATTLLAQVSLPCLVFVGGGGPFRLDLRGGTNADMAPMVEYYEEVFLPSLRRFGLPSESVLLEVMKKGYFPRGGGRVRLSVGGDATTTHSLPLKNLEMTERGKITKYLIQFHYPFQIINFSCPRLLVKASVAGTLPIRLAEEMAQAARDSLAKKFADVDIQVECFKEKVRVLFEVRLLDGPGLARFFFHAECHWQWILRLRPRRNLDGVRLGGQRSGISQSEAQKERRGRSRRTFDIFGVWRLRRPLAPRPTHYLHGSGVGTVEDADWASYSAHGDGHRHCGKVHWSKIRGEER